MEFAFDKAEKHCGKSEKIFSVLSNPESSLLSKAH